MAKHYSKQKMSGGPVSSWTRIADVASKTKRREPLSGWKTPPISSKERITEAGQPCRKCHTKVVEKRHLKPPERKKQGKGGYYFKRWLECPGCHTLYMLESEKEWFPGREPIGKREPKRKHPPADLPKPRPKKTHLSAGYVAHINSDEWKLFRHNIIVTRGMACERCGKAGPVDAHHITYERFGHELPEDVKLYCRSCHDLMHLRTK